MHANDTGGQDWSPPSTTTVSVTLMRRMGSEATRDVPPIYVFAASVATTRAENVTLRSTMQASYSVTEAMFKTVRILKPTV